MEDRLRRWFDDLERQLDEAGLDPATIQKGYVGSEKWIGWSISVAEVLRQVYGDRSDYYLQFRQAVTICEDNPQVGFVLRMYSIFRSAKHDYVNGYAHDLELRISGDVYGDFITLAKETLSSNLPVAAVLAAASLEDALKRYAKSNGIDTDERNMTDVINALKSKRLIKQGTSKALQPLPKIRNLALHAEWTKLSPVEINSVIGFVEMFLVQHFSGE